MRIVAYTLLTVVLDKMFGVVFISMGGARCQLANCARRIRALTLYGHMKTAEQRTIIQQYGD